LSRLPVLPVKGRRGAPLLKVATIADAGVVS